MRIYLLAAALILCSFNSIAQQKQGSWLMRQVQKVINDTTSADKPSTTVYPTFALSPETGVEIGFSALKLFHAKNDTLNRLSELQAFTFFTFNGQYGLWLDNAIYSDKDKWFFLGRTRIQKFPMFYYGIGPNAGGENHAVVDAFTIAIKQRVLRRVIKNVFAGPEIDFQNASSVRFNQPEVNPFELPTGSSGSTNLGLGGALVYDNRHNVLNVRKGMFGEVSFLHYNPSLGSSLQYNSINVDLRSFYPVGKRNVLAWQVLGNFQSGEIPFNQLAMMGGDMMMRGYYQGRYRDKNIIAAQTEFRMLPFAFHKRLGGSVFASSAMVAPKLSSFTTNNLKFAGGFGLRYLLFPKKDIYLRLDIGFSKEGSSFYILNGEAF